MKQILQSVNIIIVKRILIQNLIIAKTINLNAKKKLVVILKY